VADAVHIAVYYIGNILLEFNERNPGAATGQYRQQGARGGPPPSHMGPPPPGGGGGGGGNTATMPGAQTQQIFIPNALVGASKLI
jgi:heterogeneous nuclear rnp K-like protein 2